MNVHELLHLDSLRNILTAYQDKVVRLESEKWDLEFDVRKKEYEVCV